MKGGKCHSIFHGCIVRAFSNLKSHFSLSPRTSPSTIGHVHCREFKHSDEGLLEKGSNGNLLVLGLIDRGEIEPDAALYLELFKKCSDRRKLKEGQMIESRFLASRFRHYVFLQIAVMNMYAKCGDMEVARKLFDEMTERDSVCYSVLISGYSQRNEFEKALGLYVEMVKMGLRPNRCSFMTALKSAGAMQSEAIGKGIHGACTKYGCEKHVYVGSALVDMYTRCSRMREAKAVFDGLESKDEVSWNALIAAYAREGDGHNAMQVFLEMKRRSFEPTRSTYASLFAACSRNGALEQAKLVHTDSIKLNLHLNMFVGDALLDMYGKAGCIEDAKKVFYRMLKKDMVSFNTMLTAYAHHGFGQEAIDLFEEMRAAGIQPNDVAFACVLKACSHAGLLDKGFYYFKLMRKYNLEPDTKHYTRMVELLGRAGQLNQAERLIKGMSIQPTSNVWRALLGACRGNKNMEIGVYAGEHVLELDPHDSGAHVMLSNIYASAGRLSEAARVRKMMHQTGLQKEPACSWLEIGNVVHVFHANDDSHPDRDLVYATWHNLRKEIEKIGYVPDTKDVLWFADEEDKEERLQCHSEKLAIAFALVKIPGGAPILIKKNIRVCSDCHMAFRYISKLIGREITLRDIKRFHHFSHGICSCKDYW